VSAALEATEANTAIRLIDEARKTKPADIFRGQDLAATPEPIEVYRDERVKVSSVENTHFPEASKSRMPYRSLSYRFDCPGRSIVFSGDTAYSESLVKLARGADVFICEAIEVTSMRQAFERMVANGAYADNPEGVWDHIVSTHTTTANAGRMAAEAGVGLLVLNHLVPGALQRVSDETYIAGVRQHFHGKVVVGKDLMVL
jgi:ribonuclease BN (tRNA processing enzyme)